MSTAFEVPLADEARERLKDIAARSRRSEAEIAATLIEGALAADGLEAEILRKRLAQAAAAAPAPRVVLSVIPILLALPHQAQGGVSLNCRAQDRRLAEPASPISSLSFDQCSDRVDERCGIADRSRYPVA